LPDVRDGLKPVHRRVLYAMRELGNDWNKPYKKSARVVGDVIGKYHPHGDAVGLRRDGAHGAAVLHALLLVDGQGNFGSVDGDPPAAMRYTEVRMSKIAAMSCSPTSTRTPSISGRTTTSRRASRGAAGARSEPAGQRLRRHRGRHGDQHPAAQSRRDHRRLHRADRESRHHARELMQIVPGPDFPTAGFINGAQEIVAAYKTGRGRLHVRARTHFEDVGKGDRQAIIITELPYQVNKARLIERIADLVREKLIDGIASDGLRDESDKDGMRVVIELKRGEVPEILLNNLFAQTPMETVFGINMVALVDGQPRLLSLKEMLDAFLRHRREIVTRRTVYELRKARERGHILEGLAIALANIDEIIAAIKASPRPRKRRSR
jgi:DNA gyrase subunit A